MSSEDNLCESLRNCQMKALVICLSRSWGGLEQVAAADAAELAELGLAVQVLCLQGSPLHEYIISKKTGISTVPLNFRPRNYFDLKLRTTLQQLIAQETNLIHTHQTTLLGSIVPWLWRKPKIPLFASRHIMSNHNKKNFFHKAIYSRVDTLIVMSHAMRQNVLETHPVDERQIKVINLGLDFDRFDPDKVNPQQQRAQWGADDETVVIGMVGRIDPAKGQDTFIKAAASLFKNKKPGEKLKFVIVGEQTLGANSPYLDQLQVMVNQFNLHRNVVFAGYQQNIPEVMQAFDIFVMPSKQEAFGLVAIEAMAMECPIIISSGGSAEEIVGQQEFGLIVRPEDAFDLQLQLRYLLDRPEKRREMGHKSREHVRRNYDRRVRLRRTLELYQLAFGLRGQF